MKTIGMIGGMSWESTQSYYQAINQGVKAALGGLHSAKVCLYSVDFAEIEALQHQGRWDETAKILADAAVAVEAGGADFVLICTNTMHKVADEIQARISIPILHIADATANALLADGITKVGLIGTRFTMEQDFYKRKISDNYPIEVIVPSADDQTQIHDVIYQELCLGRINPKSREAYLTIIDKLFAQGAQAVILGCTEIALLVQQQHTQVPLYDTTQIHANSAVLMSLA
ncbi:aspartate/glutamate racemase family protein [Shewanella metallivivens]|uniref:Aspartate/glutamate racemase family protein n=1 Tax=Shewanella metallivivens TaxID=2872342 RepID=A0ABT5TI94_9GAMM|nr:aspartate/glutamate racemase family protein [Shewanella metallivivens]MDD8058330.1 aspartate/glutamate racemase family protein [Shewanella metallivivens]